eukprot:7383866-Prymnesium_polylepis.3
MDARSRVGLRGPRAAPLGFPRERWTVAARAARCCPREDELLVVLRASLSSSRELAACQCRAACGMIGRNDMRDACAATDAPACPCLSAASWHGPHGCSSCD